MHKNNLVQLWKKEIMTEAKARALKIISETVKMGDNWGRNRPPRKRSVCI
jgi:hypothetical protein